MAGMNPGLAAYLANKKAGKTAPAKASAVPAAQYPSNGHNFKGAKRHSKVMQAPNPFKPKAQ